MADLRLGTTKPVYLTSVEHQTVTLAQVSSAALTEIQKRTQIPDAMRFWLTTPEGSHVERGSMGELEQVMDADGLKLGVLRSEVSGVLVAESGRLLGRLTVRFTLMPHKGSGGLLDSFVSAEQQDLVDLVVPRIQIAVDRVGGRDAPESAEHPSAVAASGPEVPTPRLKRVGKAAAKLSHHPLVVGLVLAIAGIFLTSWLT